MPALTTDKGGMMQLRLLTPRALQEWTFHFRVFIRTKGLADVFSSGPPRVTAERLRPLLGPGHTPTPQSRAYLRLVERLHKKWFRKNDKAYAFIVMACEAQQSPMEVVYKHASEAAVQGGEGAGEPPLASSLLAALTTRFDLAKNLSVVQAAIADFHSLLLGPTQSIR